MQCDVTAYALSAHAECSDELTRLIDSINPREVVLVHGDGAGAGGGALADRLFYRSTNQHRKVHLPRTGDILSFGAARRVAQTESAIHGPQSAIGAGETLGASGLQRLAQQLRERGDEGRLFGETELLDLWYGERGWDEEHYGELIRLLDQSAGFPPPESAPDIVTDCSGWKRKGGRRKRSSSPRRRMFCRALIQSATRRNGAVSQRLRHHHAHAAIDVRVP